MRYFIEPVKKAVSEHAGYATNKYGPNTEPVFAGENNKRQVFAVHEYSSVLALCDDFKMAERIVQGLTVLTVLEELGFPCDERGLREFGKLKKDFVSPALFLGELFNGE